jgi:hypothetical protein
MAFDEDWDFEAGIAEQCDAVGNESAWDAPWEEDPGSPSVAASPLTSPLLPCTDTLVVDTPRPQVARRELSLSPTPKVRKVITVKRPPTPLDEAHAAECIRSQAKAKSSVQWGENGWPELTDEKFQDFPERAKYFLFYNRLRLWLARKDFGVVDKEKLALIRRAATHWKQMAKVAKAVVVQEFLLACPPPPILAEFALHQWPHDPTEGKGLDSRSILLTWNGHWGVFDEVPEKVIDEPQVVRWLRDNVELKSVWDDFVQWVGKLADKVHAGAWGCSFEVASKTWQTERQLRVHAHCFLKKDGKMRLVSDAHLLFRGSLPNKAGHVYGQSIRQLGTWAGMYYVVAPKSFSLYTFASKLPFSEFMVSPEWIFNLVQADKISYENAKGELIRCGKGLSRRLMDLEKWRAAKAEQELVAHATHVQQQLRKTNREFLKFPRVHEWLGKYAVGVHARKRFLVITGPSGVGKTAFVRSLFPLGSVLELNCGEMKHICLGAFDATKHRCIFWDELSPLVVVNNRKVFQHPACWIDLGHSPTGSHVSYHWLNDAVSIIASNRWHEDLQSMKSESDKEWLDANAEILVIDKHMFVID